MINQVIAGYDVLHGSITVTIHEAEKSLITGQAITDDQACTLIKDLALALTKSVSHKSETTRRTT